MSEMAEYCGEQIKIGTCCDMYYLRLDQRFQVAKVDGSVNPTGPFMSELRFRFPFPGEDLVAPGDFEDHRKGVSITVPNISDYVDHGSIQFAAKPGYLVSLPCPEAGEVNGYHVARNGFPGNLRIVQQRVVDGKALLICECAGCGAKFNLPTLEDAQAVIDICRGAEALSRSELARNQVRDPSVEWSTASIDHWAGIADRIEAGYRGEF